MEREQVKLREEVERLRDGYAAQAQRVERLTDRIALFEDKLEAQAIHSATRRNLPVVRLLPNGRIGHSEIPPATAFSPTDDESEQAPGVLTQADVDRLDGPRSEPTESEAIGVAPRRRRHAVAAPDNARHAGNLGVVPIPGAARASPTPVLADVPTIQDDPLLAYKVAYAQFKSGDLTKAIAGFSDFVRRWPQHDYADNALYWLGESRFARAEYDGALRTFRRVVEEYPSGNKLPDALLEIGLTLEKLGRVHESRATLSRLVAMYPDSDAASRAQTHLGGTTEGM